MNDQERLTRMFNDPMKARIASAVVAGPRPVGWSRKSVASYYKPHFANEIKPVLDQMLVDRQDVYYPYEEFAKKYGIGKDALYLRITQAIRYIIDYLDPEGKYAALKQRIRVSRKRGVGVFIRYLPELRSAGPSALSRPHKVDLGKVKMRWQQQVDEFLETATVGQDLCIDNIALSPEDIIQLKTSLAPLNDVLASVTAFQIKLVKVEPLS